MSPKSSNEKISSISSSDNEKHKCVICGASTKGQHFGKFACRACAAFFRRTVSQSLKYICNLNENCEISKKDVRKICRFCRYQKCMAAGMKADAVQTYRDTYGKRNLPTLEEQPKNVLLKNNVSSLSDNNRNGLNTESVILLEPQYTIVSSPTTESLSFPHANNNELEAVASFHHTSSNKSSHQQQLYPFKHLTKMFEGYQKFRSLKNACFSLFMGDTRFMNSENGIPKSTYSNHKKSSQFESSLAYDMIMEYFAPFSDFPSDDRNKLFKNFYGIFTCGEKGFNTIQAYGNDIENNDKLIMTDGGYIKLGEFSQYCAESIEISGDPHELARLFEASITYAIKVAVPALMAANVDEYILVALYGIILFDEGINGISEETKITAIKIKDEILKDLYFYYQTKNLSNEEMNFKMSKAHLLLPKFEKVTRLVTENFRVADIFSLIDVPKAYKL